MWRNDQYTEVQAMSHDDITAPLWKLALVWVGTVLGSVTLQHVVLFATLVYTVMQCYILYRDKIKGKGNDPA